MQRFVEAVCTAIIGYSQNMANAAVYQIRALILSLQFRALFPHMPRLAIRQHQHYRDAEIFQVCASFSM